MGLRLVFWDDHAPKPRLWHDHGVPSRPRPRAHPACGTIPGLAFPVINREGRSASQPDAKGTTRADDKLDHGSCDDGTLAHAIAQGDKAAFAEVFERHSGKGLSLAARVMGSRVRAEEVVQDVFVRLWERPERFDARRGTLRNFLLADVQGRAIDALRSDGRRADREVRDQRRGLARTQQVDLVALERVVAGDVRAAISCLSDDEGRAISLAYLGGYTYREVASILHLPEGTVKSRIRSGLARLRVELACVRTDDDR